MRFSVFHYLCGKRNGGHTEIGINAPDIAIHHRQIDGCAATGVSEIEFGRNNRYQRNASL